MSISAPSVPSAPSRRTLRDRRRRQWSRRLSLVLAPVLVLSTIGLGAWGASVASAAAIPDPTTTIALQQTGGAQGDADAKPFILAGEDATFDLTIANPSGSDGFNTSFTVLLPAGIDFVASGGMGTPVVYPSGASLPNSAKTESGAPLATVPAGMQVWVFQDVADLPATATYSSTLTVRPDADLFPVGASPDFALTGYVSADPALIPVFDGSTGIGGIAGAAETSSGESSDEMPVKALRLTKHEPSPEIELLRGVHDHQTVYTLTVENTPQGDTDAVTLVDYLPAGLEFLACATVDATADSPLLYDGGGDLGGSLEYPGAGPITGTTPADCIVPDSVETVNSGIPAGLDPGVYTKVTWTLPNLTGGTPQPGDLSAAGVPGTYVIQYVAAVPLFENTMDFVTTAGSGTPDPTGLGHSSNLNNNNGASTRQGQGAGFGDGILYDNLATVTGTYAGLRAPATPAAVSDTDSEQIQAMDLRILKSVTTGAGGLFVTGGLATYELDIATSEYMSAGAASDPTPIEIVDTLDNGLCPILPGPATAAITGDPLPADCAYPSTDAGAVLTGAIVTAIDYDVTTGVFEVHYAPDPSSLTADDEHEITYTALMRETYDADDPWVGPTTSGDSLGNEVQISGWTAAIPALTGVTNGDGVPADGIEDVWDDSAASIDSALSAISKQVLPRNAVVPTPGVAPTAAASCDVEPGAPWAQNQTALGDVPFHAGDVVCYELTVDFANEIDVRNPKVTDFLPLGVAYLDSAVYTGSNGTSGGVTIDAFSWEGQRLEWLVGAVGDGGDRYVPLDSKLVLHVLGLVTSNTPSGSLTLDKPENLMKYQQENVLGELFFLRDASAIQLGEGPTLLKGVRDVDGDATLPAQSQNNPDGLVFDSNRDGIEVAAGDAVTYRVDLSGGDFDADDMVVWDALPEGIEKADVSAISDGGTALNPGDPGYPANLEPAFSGHSVIVWTGIDVAAAPGTKTLTYDVTIPADAEVNVDYDNTASITQYDVDLNTGDTETLYPSGSLDETTRPLDVTVPGDQTRDDSFVFTPDPSIDKTLVSTEVGPNTGLGELNLDPNNGSTQAVQGELITYQYAVSIPAHTTVTDAVLKDRGTLLRGSTTVPYTVHGTPTWTASALTGATTGDFSLSAAGALTFPASYSNTSDDAQVFTVELTVYVGDAGSNNATLTNRALFDSATWDGYDDQNVTYIEPNPQITKSASPLSNVTTSDTVTYTLTVTNAGSRPISYDNTIVDTVPAGLLVDIASASVAPAAFDPGVETGAGGTITWNVAEIPPTATITYEAVIDPTTGGGESYTNTAVETGYTLPSSIGGDVETRRGTRTDDDDATITAVTAEIAKGVREAGTTDAFTSSVSEPLGQTVEYEVQVVLKANINYFDPSISDDLPAGVVLQDATITGPTASPSTGIAGTWDYTLDPGTNTATWTYDDGAGNDILAFTADRTLTLTYEVLLDGDAVAANVDELDNTAAFAWNTTNDDPSTRTDIDDSATVDLLDPVLAIDKSVSDAAPNPGEEFAYEIEVTNTGNTPAYDMTITDTVPAGVVVDLGSLSPTPTSVDAGVGTGTGGVITWDASTVTALEGPLYETGSAQSPTTLTFTYDAVLAASSTLGDGDVLTNTAAVEHFASFPTDGRQYDPTDVDDTASVNPPFPNVPLTKDVTACLVDPGDADCDVTYVGSALSWTLTATNDGDGPAQTVTVTDTLPDNWEFTSVTSITVGGAPWAGDPTPAITGAGATGDPEVLTWEFGAAVPGDAALTPGQSIVIVFTATPQAGALTDPGATVSDTVRPPHTNAVAAVTTDTSGATGNEDGSYTGPDATADAFIHRADLHLVKEAIGGDTTTGDWIPGASVDADYAQPQWQITVTNQGPDASVGPFSFVDTTTLPAGVTTGAFTARYYASPSDTTGTALTLTGAGTAPDPFVVGDGSTSLKADGSDRIVLVADVTIAASATGDAENEASVVGTTYETPADIAKDNADDVTTPLTPTADLVMDKTGPSSANAGGPLTWTLSVTNDGPSDSVSAPGALITVTDEVPQGMIDVSVPSLPAGWSGPDPTDVFQPGDLITFTLDPTASIAASASAVVFTLTGTIDPAWSAGSAIVNEATVNPGATTDDDPTDNTDDASVTPGIDTQLDIVKTRVVLDGAVWVPATALSPVPPVVPGETVTYLVEVSNVGTADARNVTVLDEVEDYFDYDSFVSLTPSGSAWSHTTGGSGAGVDQTFALTPRLTPGETASFRVTLQLSSDVATGATVENTVVADADNSTNEPTDTDSTDDALRDADLTIEKSHTDTAIAGSSLEYTLRVTNLGPSDSSGPIEIVDTLPDGFSYDAGTATVSIDGGAGVGAEPVVSGQTLTWTIGDTSSSLAAGGTIEIVFTSLLDDDLVAGSSVNQADVDGPDDTDPLNNHDDDPTTVTTLTNLSIVKDTVDAGPYLAGGTVEYTLTIQNAGPSIARDVVVTDTPDAGLTVTAMSGSGWTCDVAASPASCERDELAVGGPFTITVTASIDAAVADGALLDNVAVVSTSTPETSTTDNESTKQIPVTAEADLRLVKTAVDASGDPVSTAVAGEQARYLLEVSNAGPSNAVAPLEIVDTLPAGVTFVSLVDDADWTAVAGIVDPVSGTQEVQLTRNPSTAGLAAGASAPPVTMIVAIDPSLPVDPVTGETVVTNTATVTSGTTDPTPGDNTDTADLIVTREVDLSIVKTHDAASVRIGDEVTFDLAVRNDGPSTATGVTVVDTIPAGLTYVDAGATDPAWTVVADPVAPDGTTTVTATLTGSVDPGVVPDGELPPLTDAPTLEVTVLVTAEAYALGMGDPKTVVNTATVTAVEPETDPSDNTSDDPVVVPPQSTLVVSKDLTGSLTVGSEGRYTLSIRNDGPTADPGPIVLTDVLPSGLSFVSASGTGTTCEASGKKVECTVDAPLGVDEKVTVTLVVAVTSAAYPQVTNTVTVTTPTEQLPGSSLTDSTTDPVAQDPLARTGGSLPWWLIMAALLLLIAGGGFFAASRRRS